MRFLDYAPILHISAATGERTAKVLETIDKIAASRRLRIATPTLNKFVETITAANPPVSPGRKHVRVMYAAQIGVMPPSFVFFTNVATTFHFSYERFLINKLREEFGFVGTPIRIQVRRRAKGGGPRKRSPERTAARGPKRTDSKRREVRTERQNRKERQATPRSEEGLVPAKSRYTFVTVSPMSDTATQIEIPARALFKAAEVCELLKVQAYVLRSWEAEFPDLGVSKSAGGARIYRRKDVEQVARIKHLLVVEGLTLAGARRKIEDEGAPVAADPAAMEALIGRNARERLTAVKRGLRSILELLGSGGTGFRTPPPAPPTTRLRSVPAGARSPRRRAASGRRTSRHSSARSSHARRKRSA